MILLCFSHQWRLTYCAYEAVALLSRKLGTFVIIVLQLFYIVHTPEAWCTRVKHCFSLSISSWKFNTDIFF